MSNQPVPVSLHKFRLKVLNGPDKGVEYQLLREQIHIGRGPENDIILDDPKCSRQHATIYVSESGLQIVNVSKQNQITINGQKEDNALVGSNTIILIGSTKLKVIETGQLSSAEPRSGAVGEIIDDFPEIGKPKNNNSKFRFYAILGVISIILYFLLSDSSTKDKENGLRSDSDIEQSIDAIKQNQNEIIRSRQASGKNSSEYKEAQALFIQGFRDYREKNYQRAIHYFSGAVSIYPNHSLARRYLTQSQTKLDELIQITLLEANRHYEQKMFTKAAAKYRQVLRLNRDQNSKLYRETRERLNECILLIKDQF